MAKKSGGIELSVEKDWQAESDLRTMLECEIIEKDPKRIKAVRALAKQKMLDMAGIASEGKDD